MLPKCVLCHRPRKGKAHARAAETYTNDRLSRWQASERATLWNDVPGPRPGRTNNSSEARLARSETLTREKAIAALTSANLVEPSAAAKAKLLNLNPNVPKPAYPPSDQLPVAPLIAADDIDAALRNFPLEIRPRQL